MTQPKPPIKSRSIRLQEGESILADGRASKRFVFVSTLSRTLAIAVVIMGFTGFISLMDGNGGALFGGFLVVDVIALIIWGMQHMAWSWHRWWLTDRRLVIRHGLVGYQIQSVPLERIVDVTLRVSWLDRLFGLQHIHIRDMTGQVSANAVTPGLSLLAVEDAEAVADRIVEVSRDGVSES